jgi:hypothetical protein
LKGGVKVCWLPKSEVGPVEAHRRRVEEQMRLDAEESARVLAQARQRITQVDSLSGVAVIPVVVTRPSDLPVDRAAVFADLMAGLREHEWADPIVSGGFRCGGAGWDL